PAPEATQPDVTFTARLCCFATPFVDVPTTTTVCAPAMTSGTVTTFVNAPVASTVASASPIASLPWSKMIVTVEPAWKPLPVTVNGWHDVADSAGAVVGGAGGTVVVGTTAPGGKIVRLLMIARAWRAEVSPCAIGRSRPAASLLSNPARPHCA